MMLRANGFNLSTEKTLNLVHHLSFIKNLLTKIILKNEIKIEDFAYKEVSFISTQ